jgi:ABC-type glycerol-3-phosphate transport system substrate-binding protein
MKKTIKTNPVFLTMAIAVLAMTGYCGVEIEGEAPDIIQIALAGGPYRVALEEIIESYQKLHPNIQIRLNVISSSYQTWIRTRIAAGGDLMPDIYNGHFISGCKQKDKLVALDKYLDSVNPYTGKRWCDTFNMELAMRYRYAGRIYDLPIDYIEISMFYNKDIFKRLGLSEPETWEELLEICRKLKRAGYIPITISADTESFWLWSMGWLVRMFGDAYMRDIVPLVAARPGDWDYEPKWNENYRYDPKYLPQVKRTLTILSERVSGDPFRAGRRWPWQRCEAFLCAKGSNVYPVQYLGYGYFT